MSDTQRSSPDPRFIAAAALIGLIVIAGVVAIILRLMGDDTNTRPSETDPATSSSSSACGLPDGAQVAPSAAPSTKWYLIGRIAAPENRKIGPAKKNNGLSTCFAHSPTGALYAAATLLAETFPNDAKAERAARARMVPNAALEASLAAPPNPDRVPSQVVGFKFVDYTRDRASLTIASRLTSGPDAGALGALTMVMVWRDGDWWWDLQPSTTATAIASLEGFVAWSGVS